MCWKNNPRAYLKWGHGHLTWKFIPEERKSLQSTDRGQNNLTKEVAGLDLSPLPGSHPGHRCPVAKVSPSCHTHSRSSWPASLVWSAHSAPRSHQHQKPLCFAGGQKEAHDAEPHCMTLGDCRLRKRPGSKEYLGKKLSPFTSLAL